MLRLLAVDPYTTDFMRWACDLTDQLSSYNAPSPVNEGSWAVWASYINAIPAVAELGVQSPREFASWRDWAAVLLQATT